MDLLADLEARGLIHESTDRAALGGAAWPPGQPPLTLYYGCDPTADSLHHGNLIGLVMLRRFQDAGHSPIALAGGATGMIGDPSGRSEERNLLDDATLDRNVAAIKAQIGRIVDLDGGRGRLVDNRDWTQPISLLEFLRDVGKHATVNQMLARESVRVRLESEHGISYTEFSYMLLQANDYLWLHDHLGCELQIGGSDQWGNIISGVDLIRRKRQVGGARPGLAAADGRRRHASSARPPVPACGSIPAKTSPYQFHQHWMQLDDAELEQQLKVLLAAPARRDRRRSSPSTPRRRSAGGPSGRSPTRSPRSSTAPRPRGPPARPPTCCSAAIRSAASAAALGDARRRGALEPGRRAPALGDVVELLVTTGLASSKSDARRQLQQGSVRANGVPVSALTRAWTRSRCSTAATCCCARASGRTTSSRFLPTGG